MVSAASTQSWRSTPRHWTDWLKATWGEALYDEIRALALSDDKAHKPNLKALAAELRERWERIERRAA